MNTSAWCILCDNSCNWKVVIFDSLAKGEETLNKINGGSTIFSQNLNFLQGSTYILQMVCHISITLFMHLFHLKSFVIKNWGVWLTKGFMKMIHHEKYHCLLELSVDMKHFLQKLGRFLYWVKIFIYWLMLSSYNALHNSLMQHSILIVTFTWLQDVLDHIMCSKDRMILAEYDAFQMAHYGFYICFYPYQTLMKYFILIFHTLEWNVWSIWDLFL
jgi:hypothetical protein